MQGAHPMRAAAMVGVCVAWSLVVFVPAAAQAQRRAIGVAAPANPHGVQSLPYFTTDKDGNQWLVQNGGWLQSRGNMPVYSQGAILSVNGAQVSAPNNQARWDEKTGELIFENLMPGGAPSGVQITRRVL